jgi:exodeoxyribonuclease V alpha subunit
MILRGTFDWNEGPGFRFVETEDVIETVSDTAAQLIARYGSDDVQVIVPMNVGDYGTHVLNNALQMRLNPGDGQSFSGGSGTRIRAGDRVVQIANDYDRAIFNGELGVISQVEGRGEGSVLADFVDRDQVSYSKSEANENLKLAYALTVHKYQGSEVRWVILVLHEEHAPMLTRRLLYTAITRAKEGVVIVGQKSAVQRALLTRDLQQRCTTLQQRIKRCQIEIMKK